ncbi:glycine cleavage system protein GcvH [Pseudomonas alliivorans]|uniref:Glycine cleavage system H protein n=1 Tax=Pseudomonas alliivorans TaxID=2810613 RepID=A0ABS4C7B7_9PSED|nr:glycine cleavage system protein GcvH [Pseudomonas alliivorans]MBP0946553.1 glycine cleavage system protein GcvH [Pseudomonas alliivorans]MEE4328534.1 glycine cleavage system protein GcvH [Pseudomonas alliivorans]MEE4332757.1 glycine cleavage system protein GcvH [Pseudomonas alliivorans]MEE4370356.1 glycine cleavage system protein GcvH [Pseudomonas alliivorans]MEE4672648.1 glycine cleavage system protein GcvH [Pseudomonas alliivorans]
MMKLRFTTDHEWLRLEESGELTVGITSFAQEALGDVVYVQLPDLVSFDAGAEVVVLESVKAASNITMPLAGEVVAVNPAVAEEPELVNASPMDAGWFFRIRPVDGSAFDGLLDEAGYEQYLADNA